MIQQLSISSLRNSVNVLFFKKTTNIQKEGRLVNSVKISTTQNWLSYRQNHKKKYLPSAICMFSKFQEIHIPKVVDLT